MTEHSKNVAPCYLLDMDGEFDLTMAAVSRQHPCKVCGQADGEPTTLLCDVYSKGYQCLDPPLTAMPTCTGWQGGTFGLFNGDEIKPLRITVLCTGCIVCWGSPSLH